MLEVPSRLRFGEGQRRRRRNWVHAAVELPGVAEGDMLRQNGQRKHGTTSGLPKAHPHSEGIAYKPLCGEIVVCPGVGRMWLNK
jgi:hypothetical protein